jgi:hypothetical protein
VDPILQACCDVISNTFVKQEAEMMKEPPIVFVKVCRVFFGNPVPAHSFVLQIMRSPKLVVKDEKHMFDVVTRYIADHPDLDRCGPPLRPPSPPCLTDTFHSATIRALLESVSFAHLTGESIDLRVRVLALAVQWWRLLTWPTQTHPLVKEHAMDLLIEGMLARLGALEGKGVVSLPCVVAA